MRTASAFVAFLLLAACATQQKPITSMWTIPEAQWAAATKQGLVLNKADGSYRIVQQQTARRLLDVRAALQYQSGVTADIAIVETPSPNAFAFIHQGAPTVALSLSILDTLGFDRDALAAVFGHELAHLKLGHRGEDREKRESAATAGGQIIGTLLNLAGVPGGGYIGSYGVTAFARSFTRDEERAADELGLRWAMAAGFDPCGQAHVVEALKNASQGPQLTLLSTHPGYTERSEAAQAAALKAGKSACE